MKHLPCLASGAAELLSTNPCCCYSSVCVTVCRKRHANILAFCGIDCYLLMLHYLTVPASAWRVVGAFILIDSSGTCQSNMSAAH